MGIALMLPVGPRADAQEPRPEPLATLLPWTEQVWLALLDRDGSWHGRLSDEGVFQRFNPLEDDEYQLDLLTGLFSPSEEARWAAQPRGLRAAGSSISHPHIVQEADWAERFTVASGWALDARYRRERTLSVRRDHLRPGLLWTPVRDGPWQVGATLGMHFFKPSADVELLATRSWTGESGERRGRLNVRVAMLDAFSNVIFNALGVNPEDAPAHFDYRVLPVAVRADGEWHAGPLRLELRGGASRRSLVRVTFPETGDEAYDLSERVVFAGGLLEGYLDVAGGTALAVLATLARADSERVTDEPSQLELRLRELTWSLGARARQRLPWHLSLEGDLLRTLRPELLRRAWRLDDGLTPGTPARFSRREDRELFGAAALIRRPPEGWTGRLLYAGLERDVGVSAPHLRARNHRLVMDGGYRFASGFEVIAGSRWDLDDFRRHPFDGAHLRFSTGGGP